MCNLGVVYGDSSVFNIPQFGDESPMENKGI